MIFLRLYDSSTGQLFVEWTNADNSTASGVDLVWFEASGNFAMTADVSKYESTYGNAQQVVSPLMLVLCQDSNAWNP